MKRKRQAGQAFILVLIILAIGALVVVPTLRLTTTVLKSSQTITQRNKGLYACEAAQQYVMWMLYNDIDSLVSENLTGDGDSISFTVDVCGTTVYAGITMRAVESKGGMLLATEHSIRPTKKVVPYEVDNDFSGPYTYTITLDQLSSEDSPPGLDAVYDILPKGLDYVDGSSRLRVDGGAWTDDIGEPSTYTTGGQHRLRWPYDGFFTTPMRDFAVRQVKEIEFQVTGLLSPNKTHYNWVLLKLEDTDTLSGPQAPIKVGTGVGHVGGLLEVSKEAYPAIIEPGVETSIRYEVKITNLDGETHQIQSLTDYLPQGFDYCTVSPPEPEPYAITHTDCELPSGITSSNPTEITVMTFDTPEEDDDRYRLYWGFSPAVPIQEDEILYLTFWARTTKDVSGSYFNEVRVEPNASIGSIFQPPDMTVEKSDFNTTYSWNTGAVMVPAYDSTTGAEGENITSSLALDPDSIRIISWHP